MAYIKPAKPEHVYVKVTSDFDATDFMQWRVGKGTARRLAELGCFNSDDFSILSGIPTKTEIHPTEDWNYQAQAPSAFIIFSYLTEQMFLILHSNPLFLTIGSVFMNIIEPGVTLNPNNTRLVHCKACDSTWADRKIPKVSITFHLGLALPDD